MNSISLRTLNSKYLNIDFTNNIIFFWVLWFTDTLIIFCHHKDDGFMLTSKANLPNIISNLYTSHPPQTIPITYTSNHHTTRYLDLTSSLNHFTKIWLWTIWYLIQKPHHKYMYPHFSSNYAHHIFSGIIKTETIRYNTSTVDCQLQQTTSISFTTISHSAWGALASMTVMAPKTSLLKWIRVSSNFVVFILIRWKCQM